jgi:hypothetical protein
VSLEPIPRVISVEPMIAPQTEVEEMLHRVVGIVGAAADAVATNVIATTDVGGTAAAVPARWLRQ